MAQWYAALRTRFQSNLLDVDEATAEIWGRLSGEAQLSGRAFHVADGLIAATAIRQIDELEVYVPMLAMTHCDSADVIGKFGAASNYTLCASQWAPTLSYSDDLFGSASDFAATFEEKFGYAPPYQAAESAAAVQVFADAFERAGSLDPQMVRDALSATEKQTFYGNIKFDESGKNIAKPMVLFQIQDGEFRVVAPTKWADASVIHPRPM